MRVTTVDDMKTIREDNLNCTTDCKRERAIVSCNFTTCKSLTVYDWVTGLEFTFCVGILHGGACASSPFHEVRNTISSAGGARVIIA